MVLYYLDVCSEWPFLLAFGDFLPYYFCKRSSQIIITKPTSFPCCSDINTWADVGGVYHQPFPNNLIGNHFFNYFSIVLWSDFVDLATGSSPSSSFRSKISQSKSIKRNALLLFNNFCTINSQNLLITSSFLFSLSFHFCCCYFFAFPAVEYI